MSYWNRKFNQMTNEEVDKTYWNFFERTLLYVREELIDKAC